MNISKLPGGNIELHLTEDELGWLGQSLNECTGGFAMRDFKSTIGVESEFVVRLLDQIGEMYRAPVGHEG